MSQLRLSSLSVFVLSALGWMVLLTGLWSQVSAWTSYPVGVLAQVALEEGAPMWVRQVHVRPGALEVDTSIEVPIPGAGWRKAEIAIEANPGRYAYGLPLLLSLLLAARGSGRVARIAAGYLLLLPAQVFSLVMYVLMQMVMAAQLDLRILRLDAWQLEAIVYGYQVGSLVLPTLVPIMFWLWLDRAYFSKVVLKGWQRSEQGPDTVD